MNQTMYLTLMTILFMLGTPCLVWSSQSNAQPTREHLQVLMQKDWVVEPSVATRIKVLHKFGRGLQRLDDLGLGDAKLFTPQPSDAETVQIKNNLETFKTNVSQLVNLYQSQVKPILLNNIKSKRNDDAAIQSKAELYPLFFPNAHNHHIGKPISGLMVYQQNISDSFFGKDMVSAGLSVNFPALDQESWLENALVMEDELWVLYQMHREYLDGVKYVEAKPAKASAVKPIKKTISKVIVAKPGIPVVKHTAASSTTEAMLETGHQEDVLSEKERLHMVRDFAKALKSLDEGQNFEAFKHDLLHITQIYQQQIKPILVQNVNSKREDDAAKSNKGELLALFFFNRSNHHTGRPVMGKLRYEKDISDSMFSKKMVEAGLLVEKPELAKETFIQDALTMENELEILANEHRSYLEDATFLF